MTLETPPIARTQMLIRQPASVVYEAFIDPAITSKFGLLEAAPDLPRAEA